MPSAYRILERKRAGARLDEEELASLVRGAVDGSWADAQLGAFLMAAAIRGLDGAETRTLTEHMMRSGECWNLAADLPSVGDKHSTGGVGDKVSLILAPLLAACGLPTVMLTGRGLGHTGGTADKLEAVEGLDLALDRPRSLRVIAEAGAAIGMATGGVAPADRKLYSLRDVTATIDSIPLITASILSKKLATGAAAVVFDVKTGSGAFLPEPERALELARGLVTTARALGTRASALLTDMSQPLGEWAGHACEVRETLICLEGRGPRDLMTVTFALCLELARLLEHPLDQEHLDQAIASGRAREAFGRWAATQGASAGWESGERMSLAPIERVVETPRAGFLVAVDTKELGLLLAEAGGGRQKPGDVIDHGVSLWTRCRLGQSLDPGQELARVYLRRDDPALVERFRDCFEIGAMPVAPPPLLGERVD